jgi:hypothetical protein
MTWKQFSARLRDETPAGLERLSRLYKNTPRAAELITAELRARAKAAKSCKNVLKKG